MPDTANTPDADHRELVLTRLIRLVFTDAHTSAWVPLAKPFFTGVLAFEDEGGKTRYTARARHWTEDDCATHESTGFHEGWGIAADQRAALAAKL